MPAPWALAATRWPFLAGCAFFALFIASFVGSCTPAMRWHIGESVASRVVTIESADVTLVPDGGGAETVRRRVKLRHHWDREFSRVGGRATYLLTIRVSGPEQAWPQRPALYLEYVGNQAAILVNREEVASFGTPGDAWYDAGRQPQIVRIPPRMLSAKASALEIRVWAQPSRRAGLGPVVFGDEEAVGRMHQARRNVVEYSAAFYSCGLMLMGGVAFALWMRERDAVYGCFAVAALLGTLVQSYSLLSYSPLPWPVPGFIRSVVFGVHLLLLARFILLVLDFDPPWMRRLTYGTILATALFGVAAYSTHRMELWNVSLGLLLVFSVVGIAVVVHLVKTTRSRLAWLVLFEALGLVAAGLHDFLFLRLVLLQTPLPELTPHAVFLFVMLQAGLVVSRYSQSLSDYRQLNRTLESRIAERERQLVTAFEQIRIQREQTVVAEERQRIMREIHDGVGSQLVGLMGAVKRPSATSAELEEQVRAALDEMRMAVDSMQPISGDLATLFATLRYRLEPRLLDVGVAAKWRIGELPQVPNLAPQVVLNLQRIVLEGVTNVLKHAKAQNFELRVESVPGADSCADTLVLTMVDDGTGFDQDSFVASSRHQGLRNLRARADLIGATLAVRTGAGGTRIELRWPYISAIAGDHDESGSAPSTPPLPTGAANDDRSRASPFSAAASS